MSVGAISDRMAGVPCAGRQRRISIGSPPRGCAYQFWDEMKTHPNIPYKPFGAGSFETIPEQYR
jgi:hypothetical protein